MIFGHLGHVEQLTILQFIIFCVLTFLHLCIVEFTHFPGSTQYQQETTLLQAQKFRLPVDPFFQ